VCWKSGCLRNVQPCVCRDNGCVAVPKPVGRKEEREIGDIARFREHRKECGGVSAGRADPWASRRSKGIISSDIGHCIAEADSVSANALGFMEFPRTSGLSPVCSLRGARTTLRRVVSGPTRLGSHQRPARVWPGVRPPTALDDVSRMARGGTPHPLAPGVKIHRLAIKPTSITGRRFALATEL
jgi:hypothetical protein